MREGYATWNLEYRLVGEPGGGWPGTFEDIAAGVDKLADKAGDFNLDLTRVLIFLGHSAGGILALWAASWSTFEPGFVGSDPAVNPTTVISLAGVCDLVTAADENLGNGAVPLLMGGMPDEVPLSYLSRHPSTSTPARPGTCWCTGGRPDRPGRPEPLLRGRRHLAGTDVEYIELPDDDHFTVIDTSTDEWEALLGRLDEVHPVGRRRGLIDGAAVRTSTSAPGRACRRWRSRSCLLGEVEHAAERPRRPT